MPIENRNLAPGTNLVARYRGNQYEAQVAETDRGIRYRFDDGREFTSLSAAGSAVMGSKSCNGWRFWGLADEVAKQPAKTPRQRKERDGFFTRLEDGRFFCSACQDAFEPPEGIEPESCPQGHTGNAGS